MYSFELSPVRLSVQNQALVRSYCWVLNPVCSWVAIYQLTLQFPNKMAHANIETHFVLDSEATKTISVFLAKKVMLESMVVVEILTVTIRLTAK